MLSVKTISNENLIYFIRKAFDGDIELLNYYDRGLEKRNLDAMANDTYVKLQDYEHLLFDSCAYSVYKGEEAIGYYFVTTEPNMLISFGVNKKHRNKETLIEFFKIIAETLDYDFEMFLYAENKRATDWLVKCGMEVSIRMNSLTHLKYKRPCQLQPL